MSKVFTYGLMLWGVMFAVASGLYPLSVDNRHLFEAVLLVVLAFVTTASAALYLRGAESHLVRQATIVSVTWTVTCVALDLIVLAIAPPRSSSVEYLRDVGVMYLIIPAIVFGLAFQQSRRTPRAAAGSNLRPALHKK